MKERKGELCGANGFLVARLRRRRPFSIVHTPPVAVVEEETFWFFPRRTYTRRRRRSKFGCGEVRVEWDERSDVGRQQWGVSECLYRWWLPVVVYRYSLSSFSPAHVVLCALGHGYGGRCR